MAQFNNNSLFGTSPEMYRQAVRDRQLFNASRGGFGGAVGYGMAKLFGGDDLSNNPTLKRIQNIQSIKQQALKDFSGDPNDVIGKINAVSKALIDAGELEIGTSLLQQAAPKEDFTDFLKEERGRASKSVKALDDRASTIRGSYGKLKRLAKMAKSAKPGSLAQRAAINSMIANVVRLNSPGIVSETELKTYTGGQGSTAAMLDFLQGKGINVDAWKASIDPSGNANPDDLLAIGGSLVLGEASPLFDQYEDAKSRAKRARITKRAYETNFGEGANKNLNALRKLTETAGATQISTGKPDDVPQELWDVMTPEEKAAWQ